MMSYLIVIVAVVVSQTEITPSEDDPPFVFELKGEDYSFYGFFDQLDPDGTWTLDDESTHVILDEPWLKKPGRRNFKTDNLVDIPFKETRAHRDKRLKREGENAGYALVDTYAGKGWILAGEIELAQRAKAMAKALNGGGPNSTSVAKGVSSGDGTVTGPGDTETASSLQGGYSELAPEEGARPNFLAMWWKHGLIVIATVVLGGLVAKISFF